MTLLSEWSESWKTDNGGEVVSGEGASGKVASGSGGVHGGGAVKVGMVLPEFINLDCLGRRWGAIAKTGWYGRLLIIRSH